MTGARLARAGLLGLIVTLTACTPALPSAAPRGSSTTASATPATAPTLGIGTQAPPAAAWVRTASMAKARIGHMATLLADGRVLVAGGHIGPPSFETDHSFSEVELFDPETGTWSAGPPMPVGRSYGRAVRLLDGRVLMFGGTDKPWDRGDFLDDGVVFDPASGAWSVLPGPSRGTNSDAFLLRDGRVLVAVQPPAFFSTPPAELQIFDPSLGTWTTVATGKDIRGEPAALMADGTMLFVPVPFWRHDAATGTDSLVGIRQPWRYDPVADAWSELEPSPIDLEVTTATSLVDGRVLIVGKQRSIFYDPSTGTWDPEETPAFLDALWRTIPLRDGRVLFVGPADCVGGALPVQVLEPEFMATTGVWGLPNPYLSTRTLLDDGRVLAAGGVPACAGGFMGVPRELPDAYLLDTGEVPRFRAG